MHVLQPDHKGAVRFLDARDLLLSSYGHVHVLTGACVLPKIDLVDLVSVSYCATGRESQALEESRWPTADFFLRILDVLCTSGSPFDPFNSARGS